MPSDAMTKELKITADQLRKHLQYCQYSGAFTWVTQVASRKVGTAAGYKNSTGYMVVGLFGCKYRLHRLAWLYVHGHWPTGTIDHIDGNRLNNRISNLRDVPQSINMQNIVKPTSANTSGVLGVYWSARRKGFMASVTTAGTQKRRGPYRSIERASSAYLDMKRTLHPGCTL
jgi:hypothetical protein